MFELCAIFVLYMRCSFFAVFFGFAAVMAVTAVAMTTWWLGRWRERAAHERYEEMHSNGLVLEGNADDKQPSRQPDVDLIASAFVSAQAGVGVWKPVCLSPYDPRTSGQDACPLSKVGLSAAPKKT